jgi:hypothetical protein
LDAQCRWFRLPYEVRGVHSSIYVSWSAPKDSSVGNGVAVGTADVGEGVTFGLFVGVTVDVPPQSS